MFSICMPWKRSHVKGRWEAWRRGGGHLKLGGEDPSLIRTLGEVTGLRRQSSRELKSLRWQQSFSRKPCHSCPCGGVFHQDLQDELRQGPSWVLAPHDWMVWLSGCWAGASEANNWAHSPKVGLTVKIRWARPRSRWLPDWTKCRGRIGSLLSFFCPLIS